MPQYEAENRVRTKKNSYSGLMDRVLNQLIQLQELNFVLSEQRTLVPKTRLTDLENSLKALMENLPGEIVTLYRSVQKRHQAAVVPEANGTCSGCGMSLPTSLAAEIQSGKGIQQCPNCRRILYHVEGAPRQLRRHLERTGRPRVGIARFSSKGLMLPRIAAEGRDEAISELIQLMAAKGYVENPESLLTATLRRESIMSTALEHGLAFPHVRGVEGAGLTLSLGLKRKGLRFDTSKGRVTRIIFFLVIPSAASVFYLQLISGLIETFSEEEARKELLGCKTSEEMWTKLNSLTQETIQ
jgi:mannitol/fructose-specific phosphotransferase system IIA component (Ntr-type)